ncbi:MAG: YceI family protein [Acidimicrobiia bacterium]|nr:YceI family protein [Acidimicrobiia bacterium]
MRARSTSKPTSPRESDEPFRDGTLGDQALETGGFPTATFTPTEPIDFGTVPAEGEAMKVNASGKLTLHGVTRDVTVPLDTKLVNDAATREDDVGGTVMPCSAAAAVTPYGSPTRCAVPR